MRFFLTNLAEIFRPKTSHLPKALFAMPRDLPGQSSALDLSDIQHDGSYEEDTDARVLFIPV